MACTIRVAYRDNNNKQAYTVLRCPVLLSDSALLSIVPILSGVSSAAVVGISQQVTYHVSASAPDADSDVGRLALIIVGDSQQALYSYIVPSPVQLPVLASAPDVVDISLLSQTLRDSAVSIGSVVVGATDIRAIGLWR